MDSLLTKLAGLKRNWPVATTAGSHMRFDVADDKFQRRIALFQDDQLASELLLGSSPGFRKVHVRLPDTNAVYALTLNVYDFPAKQDSWLDERLLAKKDITRIKGMDYELNKTNNHWVLSSQTNSEQSPELDPDKARQLSQALASLRVSGLEVNTVEFSAKETILLETTAATKHRYQFLTKNNKFPDYL